VTQLTGRVLRLILALCALCCFAVAQGQVLVITKQPRSQDVSLGGGAMFDVTVDPSVPNVRYQWQLNGGNIPGAKLSSLSISNVQAGDAGIYTVAVFTDDAAVTSDPAELRITSIPMIALSDAFAGSTFLNGNAGQLQSFNLNATAEPGEPQHAGRPPRRTVWAAWRAPTVGGIATFRTGGSSFDTILAVYTGDFTVGLTEVRSDDDDGGFLSSQVSFRIQADTTYHIVVDGFGGAAGRFLLGWSFEATPDVLPLFTKEPFTQTVRPGSDVMFSVAGVSNYNWQWFFNGVPLTNQTATDLLVKNVNPLNVGTYFCRGFAGQRFRDTKPARLQINIDELGMTDPFSLSTEKLFDSRLFADDLRRPINPAAPKTIAHGFSGTQVFSTTSSTKEPGEQNHCGVVGGASEWFAYQAETNGTLYIDTDGSNFDTVLAIYTGPGDEFSSLVPVACDNNSGLDGKDSRVNFAATKNTIYWIAVDGVNNPTNGLPAKGSVTLHYRLVLPLRISSTAYTNTSGGRLTFRVTGTPNLAAAVEASTNLVGSNWVALVTNSTASGAFNYTNNGANAFSNRFYRAVNRF
jgi:hypothetical protein